MPLLLVGGHYRGRSAGVWKSAVVAPLQVASVSRRSQLTTCREGSLGLAPG